MVDTKASLLLCVFLSVIFCQFSVSTAEDTVKSLQCYNCSSAEDPKCGETMKVKGSDLEKYTVNCTGNTVACRKIVSREAPKGLVFVTRSCWSSITVEPLSKDFLDEDCKKVMDISLACYCIDEKCNGNQHFIASGVVTAFILIIGVLLTR